MNIKKITGIGLLTAVVIVLQFLGAFIRFGPFSISLTLVPIIIGAAIYGVAAGAWLGFIFGVVVLINDSALFLAVSPFGTVVTVLLKGVLCGLVSGLVYRFFSRWTILCRNEKKDKTSWTVNFGVVLAAIVCPVVNTGIFILGCLIWFMPTITAWGAGLGFESGVRYLFLGMIGTNFLIELGINFLLSAVIVKIIRFKTKEVI
ncbi:MAG: ECF transporter S component [Lachnospiraceae bacterium]|nr:ECF transporter S component [Lachnospiraceae bacterium]